MYLCLFSNAHTPCLTSLASHNPIIQHGQGILCNSTLFLFLSLSISISLKYTHTHSQSEPWCSLQTQLVQSRSNLAWVVSEITYIYLWQKAAFPGWITANYCVIVCLFVPYCASTGSFFGDVRHEILSRFVFLHSLITFPAGYLFFLARAHMPLPLSLGSVQYIAYIAVCVCVCVCVCDLRQRSDPGFMGWQAEREARAAGQRERRLWGRISRPLPSTLHSTPLSLASFFSLFFLLFLTLSLSLSLALSL